jgi:hypothetical protein
MRRALFGSLFFAVVGWVAACVGEDAVPSVTTLDGGNPTGDGSSSNSNTPGDGGSSGTTDTGATQPPPLDVRTLPGLHLWLESTKGLEQKEGSVVSWKDSSERWDAAAAEAPDGGAHVASPIEDDTGGPLFPSVVMNGVAGGRPAVAFTDGTKLAIPNHTDFAFGKGDFLIAAVGAAPQAKGTFWRLMKDQIPSAGTALRANHACVGATPDICTTPDYDPNTSGHAFVMRRSGDQLVFSIDGTPRSTYTFKPDDPGVTVGVFQTQQGAVIGGDLEGEVAELIVVVGPTLQADFDKLGAYFKTKYAIP